MSGRGRAVARRASLILRRHTPVAALLAAGVGVLWLVRPGVITNGARSPVLWLVVVGAVIGAKLLGLLVRRLTGRAAAGAAAAGAAGLLASYVLLAPSFTQRALEEPFPGRDPLAAAGQAEATAPAAPPGPVSAPRDQGAAAPAAASPARLVSGGQIDGIGHSASGRTGLYEVDGGKVLRFEDVDVEGTPGPVVHLVPRGARSPGGGLRVGELKAERGTFSYQLPPSVDLRQSWTVLVWCEPYDTPVAVADH